MATAAIFDRTISQIEDRLNLITHSHKLVSNNLANASTPGYQAKDVSFKNYLQAIHQGTERGLNHISWPPSYSGCARFSHRQG